MSWRMIDWITASISIRSASAPATATMAPYWPSNQLAVEIGTRGLLDELADLACHPDGRVRHPGGNAAHDELTCLCRNPATAAETASQTLPTSGRSHGLGPRVRRLQKWLVLTHLGHFPGRR